MIGDVLTSSILFEALKKEYPFSQLHYLIYKHTFPVVENNPYIDNFILFEEKQKSGREFVDFLKEIREEEFDIVIDVYSKIGTAITSAFSGAVKKISYYKWYSKFCYTHVVERKKEAETPAGLAVENRMRLLKPLSPSFPTEIKPKIFLTESEIFSAEKRLYAVGNPEDKLLIMISVVGSSPEKTYPPEYLAILLDEIVERTEAELLFNYIPSQLEEAKNIYNLCKPATQKKIHLDIFGKSLREFCALCYHCDALIGNEGGAINMAKALNVSTFAIFSPAINKEDWSLYEDEATNVSVHLKDHKPELFSGKNKARLQKSSADLYTEFQPGLIKLKLGSFLKNLKKYKEIEF